MNRECKKYRKGFVAYLDRELSEKELEGKIITGVLVDRERPNYHEEYQKLIQQKLKV